MSFFDALRYRLRVLGRPRAYDRELDDELHFHLSLEAMQQEQAGRGAVSAREARVRARRRFGNPTYHKEESRQMSGLGFFDTAMQDLRFAARTLRHTPGFTAAAILTLALGIGANTAIFSAVDAMLLRPLPFREPDRLMQVHIVIPASHGRPARADMPWSYLKALAFRESQQSFTSVGLYARGLVTLRGTETSREEAEVVDEYYLPTLGIQPSLGRNFLQDENQPRGKRSVLVSESFWNRRLDADPAVLGRTVQLDGAPYTIIGVLPSGFHGLGGRADLWLTITTGRPYVLDPSAAWDHEFDMIARLKPDVTPERAKGNVTVLGTRVNAGFASNVNDAQGWSAVANLLDRGRVDPMVRRSLLVLLGAVSLVLLIACANLANLFLVRASSRQREMAVRLALGASRGRVVRQLLTESLVLSSIGGAASIAVAAAGVRLLSRVNPQSAFPAQGIRGLGAVNFGMIQLDVRAFAFAAATAIVTGILFGLVPALQATRPALTAALKDGAGESVSRSRLLPRMTSRNALVILELALALVLLAGSGIMIRSLARLLAVDPGFDASGVLTLRLTSTAGARARDSLPAFYQTLITQLRGLPGVASVALGDCPPLAGGCNVAPIWFHERPAVAPGTAPFVSIHWVSPDWFKTLHVPLLSGRVFTDADRLGQRKVVLVNATAARRFWPNESPLGKAIGVGQGGFDTAYVAGVVGDVRFKTVDSLPAADVYVPFFQSPRPGALLYLRTAVDPGSVATAARSLVHALAPDVPVYDVRTLASRVSDATAQARFNALLLGLFAIAALLLAAVGIYGVISFAVAQRTREIGIRVALGADRGAVLRLIVGQGAAVAAVGLVLGTAATLAATRVLRALLFDVTPTDPMTLITVVALLAVAALIACWIPARRAARLQPAAALRD